jgi:hypothetical protein
MHEIVQGRLFTVRADMAAKSDLKDVKVIVNLCGNPEVFPPCFRSKSVSVCWDMEDEVDDHAFTGLIRMCACMMKAQEYSVAIVGPQDTADAIAACVVMEYLGCRPEIAIGIVRRGRTKCLSKSELLETILKYKIS